MTEQVSFDTRWEKPLRELSLPRGRSGCYLQVTERLLENLWGCTRREKTNHCTPPTFSASVVPLNSGRGLYRLIKGIPGLLHIHRQESRNQWSFSLLASSAQLFYLVSFLFQIFPLLDDQFWFSQLSHAWLAPQELWVI